MTKKIIRLLNEPFPSHEGRWESLRSNIIVGLFIGLFLYLFQPFGLENEAGRIGLLAIGFGSITIFCGFSFDLVCHYVLRLRQDLPSWTFWKWIVQCLVLIAWISLGNLLMVEWIYPGQQLSFGAWLKMFPGTLLIGLFPIVFTGLVIQIRAAKRNIKEAQGLSKLQSSTQQPQIALSINGENSLNFTNNEFLFAESMQNYVSICLLKRASNEETVETTIERTIIRKPLKDTLQELQQQGFTSTNRCHRSFLVNLDNVSSVSGNAQGLKLGFTNTHEIVPVSRSYIKKIKDKLNNRQ